MQLRVQESSCRGTQLIAFRSAVAVLWGATSWSDVCATLPEDSRAAVLRPVTPIEWVAERHMIELARAVHATLAGGSDAVYRELVTTVVRVGFGRVRRFFVQLAAPEAMLARAPDFWKHDHTHGTLLVEMQAGRARVELRDHVYATCPVSRLNAAEAFRSALAQTRARHVEETHRAIGESSLEVSLRWESDRADARP